MLIALPAMSFAIIMLYLVSRGIGYRQAILGAAVCFGVLLTVITELLSMFTAISYVSLAACWGGILMLTLICLLLRGSIGKIPIPRLELPTMFIGISVILTATLLTALISPPNNFDSMTYHMARVVHWIQNGSVAHYPTHITRQLYSSPWAEFAIMHIQILSGGDRLANLVQWLAMCGSITGVSLIAKEFGAQTRIQIFAALVAATIPMGILQASSTQNDYVVSFWLVSFVYFGILFIKRPCLLVTLACSSSLGLAILTKGTAYLFAFPFIIWLLIITLKAPSLRLAKLSLLAGVVVISLNAGHYWRNYALWGNPLTTDDTKLTNDHISLRSTLSNVSRNIATNTWTPARWVSRLQYQGVKYLHDRFGMNISDPATSLNETTFTPRVTSFSEDYAGNGVHLLLALSAIIILLIRGKVLPQHVLFYTFSLVGSFLLFCMFLKWQPWGTRLQLPLFVLAAPLIAVGLPLNNSKWGLRFLALFVLLCSTPWLFSNDNRPLLGNKSILKYDREILYFTSRPHFAPYYIAAAEQLSNNESCRDIGLTSTSGNAHEYQFWVLLSERSENTPQIEHINVNNISGSLPCRTFRPCATFQLR
jgi:4-amino-4-deoxy-L-arabinose transferase-like glycosyltransferase